MSSRSSTASGPAGCVLAVAGATGGVGVSVLAGAVGVRAASAGLRVACVDTRPGPGGLDVVLGLEQVRGLRWPDLRDLSGETDGDRLLESLPSGEGVVVLAGGAGQGWVHGVPGFNVPGFNVPGFNVPGFDEPGRQGPQGIGGQALSVQALASVVGGLSSATDLVVMDLGVMDLGVMDLGVMDLGVSDLGASDPVGSDPVAGALVNLLDAVVLVVGADPHQLAAGCSAARRWARQVDELFLCLRGPRPDADLADALGSALALPVLGWLADDERVRVDLARGAPPGAGRRGPLAGLAQRCVDELVPGPRRRSSPTAQIRAAGRAS